MHLCYNGYIRENLNMQYVQIGESYLDKIYKERWEKAERYKLYREHMKSELWTSIKEQIFESVGKKCEVCGTEKGLVVHHRSYANVGSEGKDDLTVLCHDCHISFHKRQKYPFEHEKVARKRCGVCNGVVNLSHYNMKGGYSRGISICGACRSFYGEKLKRQTASRKVVKKGEIHRKKNKNRSGREMMRGRALSNKDDALLNKDFEEKLAKATKPSWAKNKKKRRKKKNVRDISTR